MYECTNDGWLTRDDCSRTGMVCLVDGSNTGCRDPFGDHQIAPIKPDMPENTIVPGGSPQVPGSNAPVEEHPIASTSTTIVAAIKAVKTPALGAFASPTVNAGGQPKPSGLGSSDTYNQPPAASESSSPKDRPAEPAEGFGISGVYSGPSDISAPHYVVYSDAKFPTGKLPTAEELGGFNRFLLCFWMVLTPATEEALPQPMAPFDNAAVWAAMDKNERSALKASYKASGIAVMVSAFGATGMRHVLHFEEM
ncbi:hypothetical protein QFC22_004929 [Naganishia vaughanmartiniae]|uniref:Uncharacterized protein n=1 Tax=Naganishia vaughanmartiniae TaxID=1424756 RepID=A0ACC2WZL3_9TREE|nr:hypothetical protein QFC22_004929 [Naganishia vaughanmartiniae]